MPDLHRNYFHPNHGLLNINGEEYIQFSNEDRQFRNTMIWQMMKDIEEETRKALTGFVGDRNTKKTQNKVAKTLERQLNKYKFISKD
jgi:hypothetical protein